MTTAGETRTSAVHEPGHVVAGKYRIVRALGRGAMGITYEATRLDTGAHVALKQLALSATSDWKAVELFEREAQVLASLRHPAIPAYIEHFTVDAGGTTLYIAREIARGRSLQEAVAAGFRVREQDVAWMAQQLLDILIYLHGQLPAVFHRDIKPSNVIVANDGRLSLVDFGAARAAAAANIAGGSTVAGTFGYMAPEQLHGSAVPASDLYGLGATLLFVLTGRSPSDFPQRKLKVEFRQAVAVSPAFGDWLDRMLQPMPEERFPSAVAALKTLRGELPIQPAKAAATPRPPLRAIGRLAALLGALTIVCGVAVSLVWRENPSLRSAVAAVKRARSGPLPMRMQPGRAFAAHATAARSLALMPDGARVVTGGDDFAVKISSLDGTTPPRALGRHDARVGGVAVSRDGAHIASGGDSTVKLWDAARGSLVRTIKVVDTEVTDVAFTPDGRQVVSAGADGLAIVWDVATGERVRVLGKSPSTSLFALAVSSDGAWIATGASNGDIAVFDAHGNRVRLIEGSVKAVNSLAFAPDATVLASACDDHTVRFWQPVTGKLLGQLDEHLDEVWRVAFSPNGQYLASAGKDNEVLLWNISERTLVARRATAAPMFFGLAFLPSNDEFVTLNGQGVVATWHFGVPAGVPVPRPDAADEPLPAAGAEGEALGRARALTDGFHVDAADKVLAGVVHDYPRSALAHAFLARSAYRRGMHTDGTCAPEAVAKARVEIARAEALTPGLADTNIVRSTLHKFAGEKEKAREIALEAERAAPESHRVALLLAQLAFEEGEIDEAERRAEGIIHAIRAGFVVDRAYDVLSDVYRVRGDEANRAAVKRIIAERSGH